MDKIELANLIAEAIKDKVEVFEFEGNSITFNPINFNPIINVMQETDDGLRKRFHIEITDVLDVIKKENE